MSALYRQLPETHHDVAFLSHAADFQSPGQVVDFDVLAESFMRGDEQQQGPHAAAAECLSVEVHNPAYDYIPPHLISLFVTDTGGYTPAYVYRWVTVGSVRQAGSCRGGGGWGR